MTVKEKIQAAIDKKGKSNAIPSFTEFEMLAEGDFITLAEEKRKLDAVKKYAEARLKVLSADIEVMLIAEGATGVTWDGCVVKQGNGRTGDKVSATRLVELGVDIDLIAQATIEGKPYTFAQIVVPKDRQHPITTWAEVEANLPAGWDSPDA